MSNGDDGLTHPLFSDEWIDSTGLRANRAGKCFICRIPTFRFDVNFEAFFCDSDECNEVIANDLREQQARWENEGGHG